MLNRNSNSDVGIKEPQLLTFNHSLKFLIKKWIVINIYAKYPITLKLSLHNTPPIWITNLFILIIAIYVNNTNPNTPNIRLVVKISAIQPD